jgi:hypothetical protein
MNNRTSRPGAQTGPKSARGKANSSRNSQKHGLLSRSLIIAGEDRGEFEDLLATLLSELRPVGLLENVLAERIAITMWRQQRLVHAESSSIALRTHEKSGPAVQEFRKYVSDAFGDQGAKSALETSPIDHGTINLIVEIDGFDPSQENALELFAKQCPNAFEMLKGKAASQMQSVPNYLQGTHKGLAGYLDWWRTHLRAMLDLQEAALHYRESRFLPDSPELFVRYQSGLDNELYKAMRALREAQAWRLASLEQIVG